MPTPATNKLKIFNDPVYGFIQLPDESLFDLIEHPFFQRLRYIKQLGMTHLVYPGALHTRFHHAMGAMYLCHQAIEILRFKGHEISGEEALSTLQAIVLHDLGHGPFSHALEKVLVTGIGHETLTGFFMERLDQASGISLSGAREIFRDRHPKKFLHQLISGQLDMDRMDYLNRDSFFTGVSEGVVSWDRIIKTLNCSGNQLVIDEKGIYSIEKFLIARRLMYWQVYLHKTVIAAETHLAAIIRRARQLAAAGEPMHIQGPLLRFLQNDFQAADFERDASLLEDYSRLDDHDVFSAIKTWTDHPDRVLNLLCTQLTRRRLFRIIIQKKGFRPETLSELRSKIAGLYDIPVEDAGFFTAQGITRNNAYDPGVGTIWIMGKDGILTDIAEASDQLSISVLSQPVEKHFLCYPKELDTQSGLPGLNEQTF
jgi:uncharacterized protein